MNGTEAPVLEGIFAVSKPSTTTTPQVLLDLQSIFVKSQTFAPLLGDTRRKRAEQEAHQPIGQKQKNEEEDGRFFKMGHGGTLDPLAAGILIVGIGRGTKQLQKYLGCTKTYETVVLFGKSTDTYDIDGKVTDEAEFSHVTREMVSSLLPQFTGTFRQLPPAYSALKINGMKACDYIRQGMELPRELASREVDVDECALIEWIEGGKHEFRWPGCDAPASAPAARIRLTVSSGFYVRSFANDLGVACGSQATMASLLRSRQAQYTISDPPDAADLTPAVTYAELEAGEDVWGEKIAAQLASWAQSNPLPSGNRHTDGRNQRSSSAEDQNRAPRPKQRFRGEWLADSKKERIKQQGGKTKGKYSRKPKLETQDQKTKEISLDI